MSGGAELVAVAVALFAEHEADSAGCLGGTGPGGVGGHGHGTPVGGCRAQAGQGGLQAFCDEYVGDVAGVVAALQVPEGQCAVQQGQHTGLSSGRFSTVSAKRSTSRTVRRVPSDGPAMSVSPRAPSGERKYRSSSSTARVGSLNISQPEVVPVGDDAAAQVDEVAAQGQGGGPRRCGSRPRRWRSSPGEPGAAYGCPANPRGRCGRRCRADGPPRQCERPPRRLRP